MGILEKTRALLVSKLGSRIKDSSADARALRDLVLELERARADLLRGLESLRREEEYYKSCNPSTKEGSPLISIRADIAEGEAELKRVHAGLAEAQAAFAAASKNATDYGEGAPAGKKAVAEKKTEEKAERAGKKASGTKKAAGKTATPRRK